MKRHALILLLITSSALPNFAAAQDLAAGEGVYNKACKMCHATGMMSAPKAGDKTAWEGRIAKGEAALFTSVSNGLNKMPARGNCKSCSDDDLKNATAYLLSLVK
ncbi:MAG: cytochrome c5 family protein [Gammaproteobacteria bacterium]|nr:cytochrome c5 family protein [Gammaproteobacteria bacterium]